jgi:hypothetical protein
MKPYFLIKKIYLLTLSGKKKRQTAREEKFAIMKHGGFDFDEMEV